MVTTTQIRRYAWVVDLLLRKKGLTLRQINNEWARSSLTDYFGASLNRKVWYKCFEDIGMIYGIIIETDQQAENSKWRIVNKEDLWENNIIEWMLGSARCRNVLENCMSMNKRIDIEGFPSENGRLDPITRAMKDNRKIEVIYRKYGEAPKPFVCEPYFIKTYNHRFYVLCKFDTGHFYTLSFDRILDIQVLKEKFNFPSDLFAQEFYDNAFGVMMPKPGTQAVDIIIRAKDNARYYYEDVPMHRSQRIVKSTKDYEDFFIHIWPTNDFIGFILQQGDRLEVLSPESVRLEVRQRLQSALNQYLAS